jgi:hypothetical protein
MRRIVMTVASLIWLCVFIYGMRKLSDYENRAGTPAAAAASWPASSSLSRSPDGPTLVLFAHPQCPCTRATMAELDQIMTAVHGRLKVYVLFYRPSGSRSGWEKTDLWMHATSIPGVTALPDSDGAEAAGFGAATSGQALLYDRTGHVLFRGGITGARGQTGDNAGRRAIIALVTNEHGSASSGPVFGCSLIGPPANDKG